MHPLCQLDWNELSDILSDPKGKFSWFANYRDDISFIYLAEIVTATERGGSQFTFTMLIARWVGGQNYVKNCKRKLWMIPGA